MRKLLAAAIVLAALGGCARGSLLVERPANPVLDRAVTALWVGEVRARARTGDWLLSRAYSVNSDIIVTFSPGEEWSHLGLLDMERETVIEALGPRVREVPLASFVQRQHHLMLVRPRGLADDELRASVERARSVVGVTFDWGGTVGFEHPDKLYCTELILWAVGAEERGWPIDPVMSPPGMPRYGDVLYYSGTRRAAPVERRAVLRLFGLDWLRRNGAGCNPATAATPPGTRATGCSGR